MDRTKINVTLCKLYINLKQWNIAESCLNAANLDTTGLMNKVEYYGDLSKINKD